MGRPVPPTYPEKKAHYIGLLLPPELLDVLGLPGGSGQTERKSFSPTIPLWAPRRNTILKGKVLCSILHEGK